jgi:uncharacterized protein
VKLRTFAIAGALLVAAPLVWGFAIEPASVRIQDQELAIPGWPAGCDGLRIAVLADLHVGSPFNGLDKLERTIAQTGKSEPDLVLLAGDYVIRDVPGGTFTPPEQIVSLLRTLSAPLGVWAVLGNHDWWLDAPRVRTALESVGIPVLEDAAAPIHRGGCAFWLVGISDYWEGGHDVPGALAHVTNDAAILAFTHHPDVFPDVPARVALTIAGHTHGGQVYIPFVGRPVVPSRYGERYAIGHVVEGGRHLFVSPGLGTSIIPVRFLVPPEVSVVTLRAAPDARPST